MSEEILPPGPDNLDSSTQYESSVISYPPCTCGRSATEYCEKRECDFTEEEWLVKQNESVPDALDFDGILDAESPISYTPE